MVYEQDDQLLIRDMTAADPAIFDLEEQVQGGSRHCKSIFFACLISKLDGQLYWWPKLSVSLSDISVFIRGLKYGKGSSAVNWLTSAYWKDTVAAALAAG